MESVKLSSKGQVVIPKRMRDRYRWRAGTELAVRDTGSGIALEQAKSGKRIKLADLAGCLKHRGRPVSVATMNRVAEIALRGRR